MSEPRDLDRIVADWLRAEAPTRAPRAVLSAALDRVAVVGQERALGGRRFDAWIGRSPRLHWAIVLVVLALLVLGTIVGAGALQRTPRKLTVAPPADLQAFVLSTYDRMPAMPPVAITTLTDGALKGRMYVDGSGAVRIEHYATPDAQSPDTYKILKGDTMGQLADVGGTRVWVEQQGAISEDPRVFLLAEMEGGAAYGQPGCEVTRNDGEAGNGTAASGWTYVDAESVAGRPAFHVACGGGELWIDADTRLVLRSRGLVRDANLQPVPGAIRTVEVTSLEFGGQPAALFEIVQPSGVAQLSAEAYQCQLLPTGCPPSATPVPVFTPPPGAIVGPLPPLPPSPVKNGWIAYSTDGQDPGSTDVTTGSDIYLVREGGEPRLIAGRDGGTTRNVCPAFSPDGTRLAFGEASPQGRVVVVLGVDASGITGTPSRITVPGPGPGVCARWSSDGTHLAYVDGGVVVVRGLDGSTRASVAGDPGAGDFAPTPLWSDAVPSPSRQWSVRLTDSGIVVAHPDGSSAHMIPLSFSPYSIATWSPDGRQVLLMEDVSGHDFTMHAIAVDSDFKATIVAAVRTNGTRSWPGSADVSWQPVFP
jgi:hypothetical protein